LNISKNTKHYVSLW